MLYNQNKFEKVPTDNFSFIMLKGFVGQISSKELKKAAYSKLYHEPLKTIINQITFRSIFDLNKAC